MSFIPKNFCKRLPYVAVGIIWIAAGSASGQVLMQEDFNGAFFNQSRWKSVINDTTQTGGYANLNFHVDHPTSGANTFRDAGLYGFTQFAIPSGASGLEYTGRMRVVGAPPRGLASTFYTISSDPSGTNTGSEIDFENLTNGYSASGDDKSWLNSWNNASEWSSYNTIADFDMTAWNTYKIQWTPTTVKWFINNVQIRAIDNKGTLLGLLYTNRVPTQPMRVDVSYWKPDSKWFQAYNNQLNNATASATYTSQVDWIDVRTIGAAGALPTGGDSSGPAGKLGALLRDSFETPPQADNANVDLQTNPLVGWFSNQQSSTGLNNSLDAAFNGSTGKTGTLPGTADGLQHLYMGVDAAAPSASLTSDYLGAALANTTYNLTVAVGERGDVPIGQMVIGLLRDGLLVASNQITDATLTGGTFADLSVSFTTAVEDTAGGQLQVVLLHNYLSTVLAHQGGTYQQASFDNVRFDATAASVPEP